MKLAESLRGLALAHLVALAFAGPLLFGGTPASALLALTALALGASGLWIAACIAGRLPPRAPVALALGALLVGLAAAFGPLTAPEPAPDAFAVRQRAILQGRDPGAFVADDAILRSAWTVALALAVVAAADLARRPWQRRVLLWAIGGGSVAAAALGLVQQLTHAPGIWWDPASHSPGRFFGPFFHDTVATAYLNLGWPLLVGFLLVTGRVARTKFWRVASDVLAVGVTFVVAVALARQGSDAGRLLGILALGVLIAAAALLNVRRRVRMATQLLGFGAVAGLLVVAFLPAARPVREALRAELDRPLLAEDNHPPVDEARLGEDRLASSPDPWAGQFLGDRRLAWRTAVRMWAAAPVFGHGPGGWSRAYAMYTEDPMLRTFVLYLQFAHNDFLQTAAEYGAVGTLGWTLILVSALVSLHARWTGKRRRVAFTAVAAGAGLCAFLLQAGIEFPLQIPGIQAAAALLCAALTGPPGPLQRT